MSERVNHPLPTRELERRWTLIRRAMEERGVDVLLAQANNDFMGGYVKYLTDLPATNGYALTVVFPRDEPMTVIGQGAFGMDQRLAPEGDGIRRGVGRLLGVPSYASAYYTAGYDSELASSALEGYRGATIGLLGIGAISHALIDGLRRGALSNAELIDASELVDPIKAVKSEDELVLVRETALAQDAAMQAAFAAIRPGMTELQVAAVAEHAGHDLGSEQGLFLAFSAPSGSPGQIVNRHLQARALREGDQFSLLVENNGPGGFYCELGRTAVLGRASDEMLEQQAFVLEAQEFCTGLLGPGADPAEIWERYNAFMRDHGRPEERRVHFHGQGYDMVERPLIRFDETLPVGSGMYFALHPAFSTERTYSWACDNFLLHDDGGIERLHRMERRLFELG
ncbi:MAG TPA: M24 family metallopeptidase [Candidatus Dormibacteraeota bacterium]|nr:M24 family metallopeptidase [Candidatus Dormibacteraeota bacterium]